MSSAAAARPFIVAASALMLKRNIQLSKNARRLYMTLRALADGRPEEGFPNGHALRQQGRWLKATRFDSEAEMCRDIRMRCMKELIALGYVTCTRDRVLRFIGGRKRMVGGAVHYFVHIQPITPDTEKSAVKKANVFGGVSRKITEKPNVLLKSISSTVEEIDSQDLPETPTTVPAAGVVCLGEWEMVGTISRRQNHHENETDDDSSPRTSPKPESKQETAKAILLKEGYTGPQIDVALLFVSDINAAKRKSPPRTVAWFVTAARNALGDHDDRAEIENILANRNFSRIPSDAPLNYLEKPNASKVEFIHRIVEEASLTAKPAAEVLARVLQQEKQLEFSNPAGEESLKNGASAQ